MTAETDLLPCPGCNGTNTRVIGGPGTRGGPEYWAGCDQCRWRTWGNTEAEAIAAWNTRANLAELQREVEGLRAEVETRKEDYATLTAMWRADEAKYRDRAEQAEARAERLAGALRDARSYIDVALYPLIIAAIDAALDQETTNG